MTNDDHKHEKCCRYLRCAHPMCCGYYGQPAADALAGDKTTRPSEGVAPTDEYLRAREESTKS